MDIRIDFTNKIKFKPIKSFSRFTKELFFILLNFSGSILFLVFRSLRLLSYPQPLKKDKINRIIIFRPDAIGDVVIATPVIKAVRSSFTHAHIAMAVSGITKDIVINNPYLNEVIEVKGVGFKNLFKDFETISFINKKKFDLALVLFPALSCNIFVFLTGIPHRIGYGDRGSVFLLTKSLRLGDYGENKRHMVDINLDLARAIGCETASEEMNVSIHEDSEERAKLFLEKNSLKTEDTIAMIHLGSSKPYQRWAVEKFALLADRLIKELNVKIIFLSGPLDEDLADLALRQMRNLAVLAQGLPLRDVVSLIRKCDLFIGHSTGPTHIADAAGVRTIMIIGFLNSCDSPDIWGTRGNGNIMISKDRGCKRCIPGSCLNYECIRDISVQEVFETAKLQLNKVKQQ